MQLSCSKALLTSTVIGRWPCNSTASKLICANHDPNFDRISRTRCMSFSFLSGIGREGRGIIWRQEPRARGRRARRRDTGGTPAHVPEVPGSPHDP